MGATRAITVLVIGALVATACGADTSVTVERADEIAVAVPPVVASQEPATPDEAPPGTTSVTTPGTTSPPSDQTIEIDTTAIDFGPDKPAKAYDEFLLAVMTDLEIWWGEQYPQIYGSPFRPLEGGVYAAYPGRPDDIPGCGSPRTTYDDVRQFVAFYCGIGDFMVYDDGDDGLLAGLAREYGAGTIGTVLAHEFGHAIQLRSGALDRELLTITTEQQADCFAGAWTGRAARGEAATVRYNDGDVRAGLIAMINVADPVGIDQFLPGGHGTGFDRVGAFQVGFLEGPARCAALIDDPLPLMPNYFTSDEDVTSGGNAAFGYGDDELLGFIPEDLNDFWDEELEARFPQLDALTLRVVDDERDVECADLRGDLDQGVTLCASTGEVLFDESVGLDLYRRLGDFSVGFLLANAWAEAVQVSIGSELDGEPRALLNDCLTGGWVKTVIPIESAGRLTLPQPRLAGREVVASAGDLDEAIDTVLLFADLDADDDVRGNAFEKIDAFRTGVLDGIDACLADL